MHTLLKTGVAVLVLAVSVVSSQAAPTQPPVQSDLYEYTAVIDDYWDQFGE